MSGELPLITSVGLFYYVSPLSDAAVHSWKLLGPCVQAEGKLVLLLQGRAYSPCSWRASSSPMGAAKSVSWRFPTSSVQLLSTAFSCRQEQVLTLSPSPVRQAVPLCRPWAGI